MLSAHLAISGTTRHSRSGIASAPAPQAPRSAPAPAKVPLLILAAVLLHGVTVMAVIAMLLMLLLRHMRRLLYSPSDPKPSCLPLLRGLIKLPTSKLGGPGVTGRVEALTRT